MEKANENSMRGLFHFCKIFDAIEKIREAEEGLKKLLEKIRKEG